MVLDFGTILLWGGGILFAALLFKMWKPRKKDAWMVGTGAALVIGLVITGTFAIPGLSFGADTAQQDDVVTTTTTTTTGATTGGVQRTIEDLNVQGIRALSNDPTAAGGTLRVYRQGTDPADPNSNALLSISLSSGVGRNNTAKVLRTSVPYAVYYDGAGTEYDQHITNSGNDYIFPVEEISDTGTISLTVDNILAIGTIDDALDETSANSEINGATNTSLASGAEIGCSGASGCSADSTLVYDESNGDGQFYIEPTFSVSSANTGVIQPVMCAVWDLSNPPEGNEVSSLTYQSISGTNFGLASNLANWWNNEQCVSLGSQVDAGTSGKFRLTITYTEANLDTTDDWTIRFDDMGDFRGKDLMGDNVKATHDTITFDAQT